MRNQLKTITVQTLQNGYSLEFDGQGNSNGYMYFTPEDLLKGFMLHIGLNMTNQLSMENIDDFITAAINWNENGKCISEIERMQAELKFTKGRRNSIAAQLIKERAQNIAIIKDVKKLIASLREYPDRDIVDRIDQLIRGKKLLKPITLESLGIVSSDIIYDEDE